MCAYIEYTCWKYTICAGTTLICTCCMPIHVIDLGYLIARFNHNFYLFKKTNLNEYFYADATVLFISFAGSATLSI